MTFEENIKKLQNAGWLEGFEENEIIKFINKLNSENVRPKKDDIFNAFKISDDRNICKPEDVKVLILGQDPYPDKNKAHGYAFSFGNEKSAKDSLLNILKAIQAYKTNTTFDKIQNDDVENWNTDLSEWAKDNGVLLLNTALTYESNEKMTTHIEAWKPFIKQVVNSLLTCDDSKLVVFLWGDKAKTAFFEFIKNDNNNSYMQIKRDMLVLISNHPSNLSVNRGGNFPILAPNHFKACDAFLDIPIWKNFGENNNDQQRKF